MSNKQIPPIRRITGIVAVIMTGFIMSIVFTPLVFMIELKVKGSG
jgi:hypothetical protein